MIALPCLFVVPSQSTHVYIHAPWGGGGAVGGRWAHASSLQGSPADAGCCWGGSMWVRFASSTILWKTKLVHLKKSDFSSQLRPSSSGRQHLKPSFEESGNRKNMSSDSCIWIRSPTADSTIKLAGDVGSQLTFIPSFQLCTE